jgi:hypothetical protein
MDATVRPVAILVAQKRWAVLESVAAGHDGAHFRRKRRDPVLS